MKKILVAIDFSQVTKTLIEEVKTFAKEVKAEIRIVHTEEPPIAPMGIGPNYILFPVNIETEDTYIGSMKEVEEQEKKRSRTRLNEIQAYLEQNGIECTTTQLSGEISEMIVSEAEEYGANYIFVGAHEHGSMYRLFFGSVRDSIISTAKCPVVVIPPTSIEEAE